MRGWLELLPDEVVRVRPVLSVGFAAALLARGELEGVEARLRDAERWLDGATSIGQGSQAPPAEMVVVDGEAGRGRRAVPHRARPDRAALPGGRYRVGRAGLPALDQLRADPLRVSTLGR